MINVIKPWTICSTVCTHIFQWDLISVEHFLKKRIVSLFSVAIILHTVQEDTDTQLKQGRQVKASSPALQKLTTFFPLFCLSESLHLPLHPAPSSYPCHLLTRHILHSSLTSSLGTSALSTLFCLCMHSNKPLLLYGIKWCHYYRGHSQGHCDTFLHHSIF